MNEGLVLTKLKGYESGPLQPEQAKNLHKLLCSYDLRAFALKTGVIREICTTIGATCDMDARTDDCYRWFSQIHLQIKEARAVVLIPYGRNWTLVTGRNFERSVAIYLERPLQDMSILERRLDELLDGFRKYIEQKECEYRAMIHREQEILRRCSKSTAQRKL